MPQYQRAESPLPTASNQKNTNTQHHTTLNYVVALHLKCWAPVGKGVYRLNCPETPSLRRSADEPHSSGQSTLQQIKNITTSHNKPYGEGTQQKKLKPWRIYMFFAVICRIWKTILAENTPRIFNLITSSPDKQNLLTISR